MSDLNDLEQAGAFGTSAQLLFFLTQRSLMNQSPVNKSHNHNRLIEFPNQILLFYGEFVTLACFLLANHPHLFSFLILNCLSNKKSSAFVKTRVFGAEGPPTHLPPHPWSWLPTGPMPK
jgi:hypothetical protein